MYYLDGRWRRNRVYFGGLKTHPRMSRAVPSGRREGMFPGRYAEIFGLGERLGCILNLGHSFLLTLSRAIPSRGSDENRQVSWPLTVLVCVITSPSSDAFRLSCSARSGGTRPKKKKWFWQKETDPEANPEEKIKPAPAWAVYCMLVVWYGAALVLNGTFRSALVQDLGGRGA